MRITDSAIKKAADSAEHGRDGLNIYRFYGSNKSVRLANKDTGFMRFAKAVRMAVRLSKEKK